MATIVFAMLSDTSRCLSNISFYPAIQIHDQHGFGDLTNAGGLSAAECASWCCDTAECMCFFHTKSQLVDAGNCTAGKPCCWLKPTFNTTRLDDQCADPTNCLSGVLGARVPAVPTTTIAHDSAGRAVNMTLAGLGTGGYWVGNDSAVYAGVRSALRLGYTHLDTALGYKTQSSLARAVNDSGVPRSRLFIVSKIPGHLDGPGAAAAIASSVSELGAPIDLMLIHFPGTWSGNGSRATRQATWRELEKGWRAGALRAIGVSHFCPRHVDDILEVATVPIAANQVEYHVGMGPSGANRTDDPDFDRAHGITYESFMPFCGQCGDSELITGNLTNGIGAAHGKTGAQVALRWLVQQGIPAIPRSGSAAHQLQNLDIFDFALSDAEMAALSAFTKPKLAGEGGDCDVP